MNLLDKRKIAKELSHFGVLTCLSKENKYRLLAVDFRDVQIMKSRKRCMKNYFLNSKAIVEDRSVVPYRVIIGGLLRRSTRVSQLVKF